MIFCLVAEYALRSSSARFPALDRSMTSCWSITATFTGSTPSATDDTAHQSATRVARQTYVCLCLPMDVLLYKSLNPMLRILFVEFFNDLRRNIQLLRAVNCWAAFALVDD